MNLGLLLDLIEELPDFPELVNELKSADRTQVLVPQSVRPYLIAAIHQRLGIPLFVVTAHPEDAARLFEQLQPWVVSGAVRFFPEPDALPYQRVTPDISTEIERQQALFALSRYEPDRPPLVVTSASACMQKIMSQGDFAQAIHTVKAGMVIAPATLLSRWQAIGYRLETTVEVPGTMSHRGGIIDVYPPTSDQPARLEFFGNTVESIRLFDPLTQRSQIKVESVTIGPASELIAPLALDKPEFGMVLDSLDLSGLNRETGELFRQELAMLLERQVPHNMRFYASLFNQDSIFSYLPQNALLVMDGPSGIESVVKDLEEKAAETRSEMLARGELPPNFPPPHFTWPEMEAAMQGKRRLMLPAWETAEESKYRLRFSPAPSYAGQLPAFIKNVREELRRKKRVIITSYQASRLAELLDQEGVLATPATEVKEPPSPGSLMLIQGSLADGWVMNGTCLFTDTEIFGFTKERRLVKRRPVARRKLLAEFRPGEYMVHVEHGIGKFVGVTTMGGNGNAREYLVLKYAAGDRLLVPLDQIDRVDRYIGATERPPTLSRLGTQEWVRTTQRVKESAEKVARELIELYASREVHPGFAFSPDSPWQQELEASFPYVETPDQVEVLEDVKENMEQPKPMDRLVCGDVGYGKTEIALRASFKAVMDSKQVAMLVPTTVLAQQHFTTFNQRLRPFPVRVEVLSRFRKRKEQKAVIEGLANGTVDICIGTHRLLQKDVIFKDLGLLVIDEEQRFGVTHKEHLKKLRQEVDVLTLSATPIPRTLNMALTGVRDMSVMDTPPEDRQPVKTYVAEYDERLVRDAILRELERNGQVFFVHNRVQGIHLVAQKLRALVPEAKIAIAHGQMPEGELAAVMSGFTGGESDVLVCTTIIESGLDMPRVNSLIVNRADKFGLTQLYQLRGRVGRGANLAYAYFLYDRQKRLTPTAEKRLRTIFEATELGAGFGIAMKDLEIRGAGSLLGMRQSGNISAVGFSLYTRLLAAAVEEIKSRQAGVEKMKAPSLPQHSIDLPLPAHIPEDYVADLSTRLGLYQDLISISSPEQVEVLALEFRDRFGPLPPEVDNLLFTVKIKVLAGKAGIESISTEDSQIVLRRFQGMEFDKKRLEGFIKEGVRVDSFQLRFSSKRGRWRELLERVVSAVP